MFYMGVFLYIYLCVRMCLCVCVCVFVCLCVCVYVRVCTGTIVTIVGSNEHGSTGGRYTPHTPHQQTVCL